MVALPLSDATAPRAAAILHDGSLDVDALLARLVARQRGLGRRVRGLEMSHRGDAHDCAAAMVLVDVDTRDEYLVSQALGPLSTACRADLQGFARASEVLRRALDEVPDLVLSNRFGGLEVAGGGFCAELLALMVQDIPLLTVVATRHVDAWRAFTGGAAVLPARDEVIDAAIDAWLARDRPALEAALPPPAPGDQNSR